MTFIANARTFPAGLNTLRRFRRAVWPLLPWAVAGACSGAEPRGAGGADSLYIAVAAARAPRTEPYFNGVLLAAEHLNARRSSGQKPFAVRYPPDATSQVAIAAAFRDDRAVIGVVGHTGSAQTLEAAPVYADRMGGGRRAVVAITPTATNPRLTAASEWVFRVCPTDHDVAEALARYAADSLRARRAAVVYRNDLFGRGFTRAFRRAFEQRGGLIVERDPYLAGITEYEAYAARIARVGADALVIAGGAEDAAQIVRSLRAAGADLPVLGTDDLAALAADAAAAREFRGLRYSAFFLPGRSASEPATRFVSDYQRRFGSLPDHRAALSYDAAMLIGLAALEAGPGRRAIRDWVASVGRGRPPYTGATGVIRMDESGDAIGKPVLVAGVGP